MKILTLLKDSSLLEWNLPLAFLSLFSLSFKVWILCYYFYFIYYSCSILKN